MLTWLLWTTRGSCNVRGHTACLLIGVRPAKINNMPEHPQIGLELFWQEAFKVLERILQTQANTIREAALLFADCIEKNGIIQVYGTGHSRALAMELAGRAGGLVPVNRIDLEDLALHAGWSLERVKRPAIERDLAAGQAILGCYHIELQDVFIILSSSGVNAA